MNIPGEIKIGGIDYIIENEKDLNDGNRMLSGQIVYQEGKILLNSDIKSEHYKGITLWHEILHGIAENACLEFDEADEETIIDVFAKGIYQVLQDNCEALFGKVGDAIEGG